MLQDIIDKSLIHTGRRMFCYAHTSGLRAHRNDWTALHSILYSTSKIVCKLHYMLRAAEILRHLNKTTIGFLEQLGHKFRIGTAELKNILVIISDSDYTHFLICCHQSAY